MENQTQNSTEAFQNSKLRHRDTIEEIIGNPPGWLLKWGISFIFLLLSILGLLSWLVKYPDIMPAPMVLTTESPAIRVVAKTSGKIEQLFIDDQEYVEEDQVIALVESQADWKDIQQLKALLQILDQQSNVLSLEVPEKLYVGSLQVDYTQLVPAN